MGVAYKLNDFAWHFKFKGKSDTCELVGVQNLQLGSGCLGEPTFFCGADVQEKYISAAFP